MLASTPRPSLATGDWATGQLPKALPALLAFAIGGYDVSSHNLRAGCDLMNLGMSEMIFIFLLALIIFGPKRLPEIGRQIGKALNDFKRASNEFKFQLEDEIRALEASTNQPPPQPAASDASAENSIAPPALTPPEHTLPTGPLTAALAPVEPRTPPALPAAENAGEMTAAERAMHDDLASPSSSSASDATAAAAAGSSPGPNA